MKKAAKFAAFFTSHLAGRAGFEPAVELDTRQPLSRRPHSTTLAPPQLRAYSGGRGIRTHGGLPHTCFQDRRLKPLGHPSSGNLSFPVPSDFIIHEEQLQANRTVTSRNGMLPQYRSPLENDLLIQPIHHKEYGRVYYRSSNQTWHPRNNNKQCRQEKQHDK